MRPITPTVALLAALASLCAGGAPAQNVLKSPFEDRLNTIAGELEVVELERDCRYKVMLNGESLVATDCNNDKDPNASAPIPQILVYSNIPAKPFSQVVIVQQQMVGNACNGGPIWLLGLKADGTSSISKNIDFCGGIQPTIVVKPDRIVISIPGGTRSRGKGQVPAEVWIYQNGGVTRVK